MSAEEEPPTKKVKSDADDWKNHKLNIAEAVMKADEGSSLTSLATANISTLQGIGLKAESILEVMNVKTVTDLADYKYYKIACSIQALASAETDGGRPDGSVMNVDKAMDKEFETKSLKELLEAPLSALEGLTTAADDLLKHLGVKSIGDLADFKYCKWASAIVELSKYEETKTAHERNLERELKKLS